MPPSAKRADIPAYYEELADKLDEASDHARAKTGDGHEIVERLKTYAERIRSDVRRKNPGRYR